MDPVVPRLVRYDKLYRNSQLTLDEQRIAPTQLIAMIPRTWGQSIANPQISTMSEL